MYDVIQKYYYYYCILFDGLLCHFCEVEDVWILGASRQDRHGDGSLSGVYQPNKNTLGPQ